MEASAVSLTEAMDKVIQDDSQCSELVALPPYEKNLDAINLIGEVKVNDVEGELTSARNSFEEPSKPYSSRKTQKSPIG